MLAEGASSALMSVHGTAPDDVWMVGADTGQGPPVLHYDGAGWALLDAGVRADLWWVHALRDGALHIGGSNATVLAYRDGAFQRMHTPGLAKHTVYGVWASADDDVYAVGSVAGRDGFIWHFDGQAFTELPLPVATLPRDPRLGSAGFLKVWGASADEVWVVGDRGVVLRGNARDGFLQIPSSLDQQLFTVHGAAGQVVMVGGSGNGLAVEAIGGQLHDITPPGSSVLQGVSVSETGPVWAVGLGGNIYDREAPGREWHETLTETPVQSLHAVWVDPAGEVWTVGGNVLVDDLDGGVALHGSAGRNIPPAPLPLPAQPGAAPAPVCAVVDIDPAPAASIARRWNEQLLGAIRRDVPRDMVQARNLFHLSVAIWDAWAAYDASADGYVVTERASATDVTEARREAISYAAYRVLAQRFASAAGGALSQACFSAFMRSLGYDPLDRTSAGDTPRALGNRIGRAVLDAFADDGANEEADYADPAGVPLDNPPLKADVPGIVSNDPLRWQPILLQGAITLNGIELGSGGQRYTGSHWGKVAPFALARPAPDAAYLDIGRPPTTLDPSLLEAVVDLIGKSGQLGIEDGVRIDVSPGATGNNSLGADDGRGRPQNPVTGLPYEARLSLRGDFTRSLVAYWENGPRAETPPGHWNVLANAVADDARFERRLFGASEALDPLAWDAHLYLALNGALHDAAIAAWELKRRYLSARPISLVRYLVSRGQRDDPGLPLYDPGGLLLVDDSIEVITAESSAPGERHAAFGSTGSPLVFRAWPGEPGDRARQASGVRWIRAEQWVPFQRRSFVSPPSPGYVSEHSAFARAAAEVLTRLTGSEYFPGGLGSARVESGALQVEAGPSQPVELGWATYGDAADQAGQACIWAGINVSPDDLDGRRVGARVGEGAALRASGYFDGSARP